MHQRRAMPYFRVNGYNTLRLDEWVTIASLPCVFTTMRIERRRSWLVRGAALVALTVSFAGCSPELRPNPVLPQIPSTGALLAQVEQATDADAGKAAAADTAELWFAQDLADPGGALHSVFITTAERGDDGQRATCHTCDVGVSVASFRRVAKGWEALPLQRSIFRTGSWGKVERPAAVTPVVSADHAPVLLVRDSYSGQGTTTVSLGVLAFLKDRWVYGGAIPTKADNKGECSTSGAADEQACYAYRSTVSVNPGPTGTFPPITRTTKGTQWESVSENGSKAVSAAGVLTYRYNNEQYTVDGAPSRHADPEQSVATVAPAPAQSDRVAVSPATLSDAQLLAEARATVSAIAVSHSMSLEQYAASLNTNVDFLIAWEASTRKTGSKAGVGVRAVVEIRASFDDPQKARMWECFGVHKYHDPQPVPLPTDEECRQLMSRAGITDWKPPSAR